MDGCISWARQIFLCLGRYTLDYPLEVDSTNITSFGFLGISCGNLRIADIGQNDLRVWEFVGKNHWEFFSKKKESLGFGA